MRRIAVLPALCLALAVLLTACKPSITANTETAAPTEAFTSEVFAASSGVSAEKDPAAETETASSAAQSGTDTRPAADTTASDRAERVSGQTVKPSGGSEQTTAADTADGETPSGTAKGTTAPAAAQKPPTGTTTKPSAPTTKSSGAQTSTTKPSGSVQTSTTKPSGASDVSKPAESTTASEPSTTKPPVSANAVTGKLSYLNNAAVTYLSALNADDLKAFGITGDKQKDILKNKKDWAAYTIQVDFRSHSDNPLTLYYLDVTDNGKGDIYVCGDMAGELGMAPNGRISEKFYVLAKKNDADIDVRAKLGEMAMRVQYAETPTDDNMTPVFQYAKIG